MHGNHLSGSIPLSFHNLGSLTYLYVMKAFFNWFCPFSPHFSSAEGINSVVFLVISHRTTSKGKYLLNWAILLILIHCEFHC